MNDYGVVDFLVTGTAVVPATLLLGGHVGVAIMIFLPLMIGACLTSAYLENSPERARQPPP